MVSHLVVKFDNTQNITTNVRLQRQVNMVKSGSFNCFTLVQRYPKYKVIQLVKFDFYDRAYRSVVTWGNIINWFNDTDT